MGKSSKSNENGQEDDGPEKKKAKFDSSFMVESSIDWHVGGIFLKRKHEW